MGLFKSLKKLVTRVWKGITTKFKKLLKPVGKFLDSSLGKAVMLGVTIFSMGTALLAGGKAFLGAEGFLNKFVQGGKAFMNSMLNKGAKEGTSAAAEGAGSAAAEVSKQAAQEGATNAANLITEGAGNAVEGVGNLVPSASKDALNPAMDAIQQGGNLTKEGGGLLSKAAGASTDLSKSVLQGGAAGPTKAMAASGLDLAGMEVGKEAGKGWLSKAASGAMDFIKSDSGANLVGSAIKGVGNYYTQKDQQEYDDRIRREFRNPNDPYLQQMQNFDYNVEVPANLAGNVARSGPANVQRPQPSVPFQRTPYGGG